MYREKICLKVLKISEKELTWSLVTIREKLGWEKTLASLCVLTVIKNTGILVLFPSNKEVAMDIPTGALSKQGREE